MEKSGSATTLNTYLKQTKYVCVREHVSLNKFLKNNHSGVCEHVFVFCLKKDYFSVYDIILLCFPMRGSKLIQNCIFL